MLHLLSVKTIKELLARHDAAALKRFGQNFLINQGILQKIIGAAELSGGETVLEIGPGVGTLTRELAKHAKKVIAVEMDRKMVEILKETMADCKNIEIIQGDILKLNNWPIEQLNNYKIVANLPYNIATAVIRKFLEMKNQPSEMILMLQKEVARRICASPVRSSSKAGKGGQNTRMSLLAVSVQFYARPKIISYVTKGSFWPQPKVDSAIIKIIPHQTSLPLYKRGTEGDFINPSYPPFTKGGEKKFFMVLHAGFSAPRKQLINNLSKKLNVDRQIIKETLKKIGLAPARRAQTLELEDWIRLSDLLKTIKPSP